MDLGGSLPVKGGATWRGWRRSEASRLNRRRSTIARDESLLRSIILPAFGESRLADVQAIAVQGWVAQLAGQGLCARLHGREAIYRVVSTRHSRTGSSKPLRVCSPAGSNEKPLPRASWRTVSAMRISPAPA